ncbi:MAG: helix-turn-helix domain-containing protein [Syntrophomonadaceae bacterium]|jgi:DNA-directed RNA polymerase specialized sigma subunit|nr:helix-turn-helix domain-containing protein [Syntrophomonadaceae bacterium]
MQGKQRLQELVAKVKNGDQEAVIELVNRFVPLVKKYGHRMGYDEATADLTAWIVHAVHRYEPNTMWGRNELNKFFSRKNDAED